MADYSQKVGRAEFDSKRMLRAARSMPLSCDFAFEPNRKLTSSISNSTNPQGIKVALATLSNQFPREDDEHTGMVIFLSTLFLYRMYLST